MSDALDLDDLLDDPAAHRRLCALLRLCGSDVMGEKAAAADGLARMAKDRGWTWEKVIPTKAAAIARIERETQIAAQTAKLKRTLDEGPRYSGASAFDRFTSPTHVDKAREILEDDLLLLRTTERRFLESMTAWRGTPTEKQAAWLDHLWSVHCAEKQKRGCA